MSCVQRPPAPPVLCELLPAALVLPPVVPALVPPVEVLFVPAALALPPVDDEAPLLGVGFGLLLLDEQATANNISAPAKLEAKSEIRFVVFMLLHLTIAVVADLLSGVGTRG